MKRRDKKERITLVVYAAVVLYIALAVYFLAELEFWGWIITLLSSIALIVIPVIFLRYKRKIKIFYGKIERIEEDRKIVPQKGTGAFGSLNSKTAEVYELLIAITDENQATQVIFCPSQYEKLLKVGDVLLCHSALPYPAHLSNPTNCICMHCGTMQASENLTCITCGANIYSLYTLTK